MMMRHRRCLPPVLARNPELCAGTMSCRIDTILIIGAATGIGEALARRFHALGNKVIATGREQSREALTQLSRDLPGLDSAW
ncbi:hypothetical protein LX36DRAFT_316136 [Colletotrichum falcatum]|nr:hypothetical protein LX36DRAFT_316136 [Colletotrichum falcatum]